MLKIYNTLNKKIEDFTPLKGKNVGMYTCGPTVYNYAHIGNLRTYVFEDILKRVLIYNKCKVQHVMNITDVGHLTSDADEGEDKMEKGAKREGKTAWDIAKFYTKTFKNDLNGLNIIEPDKWCKATDHIKEQIKMVQKLIDKGYTYETSDGIYFDTTKVDDYGKLANLKNQDLQAGARVEMGEKKNPHDFALWKFSPTGETRQMEWDAPFGVAQGKSGRKGFPGWHIECSAMSMKYLGEQFDIHCGGIDHVSIHHTNEIAQSEAVTDKKPWVKYWLHGEFLNMGSDNASVKTQHKPFGMTQGKMSKSGDNFITLQTLKTHNINPLAYRYLLLQTHYRKQLSFNWEALEAAGRGLERLYDEVMKVKSIKYKACLPVGKVESAEMENKFSEAINDDLNMPQALAVVWDAINKKNIDYKTLLKFDEILGLKLKDTKKQGHPPSLKLWRASKKPSISKEIDELLNLRKIARENKNWAESDRLRDEIKKLGYDVEDTSEGQKISS